CYGTNIYIAGNSNSNDSIATQSSFTDTLLLTNGLYTQGFLASFDSSGSLQWGTYLGMYQSGAANAVVCDETGNIYVGGNTFDTAGIATQGAWQPHYYY